MSMLCETGFRNKYTNPRAIAIIGISVRKMCLAFFDIESPALRNAPEFSTLVRVTWSFKTWIVS